jgi:hypothetical protein
VLLPSYSHELSTIVGSPHLCYGTSLAMFRFYYTTRLLTPPEVVRLLTVLRLRFPPDGESLTLTFVVYFIPVMT